MPSNHGYGTVYTEESNALLQSATCICISPPCCTSRNNLHNDNGITPDNVRIMIETKNFLLHYGHHELVKVGNTFFRHVFCVYRCRIIFVMVLLLVVFVLGNYLGSNDVDVLSLFSNYF